MGAREPARLPAARPEGLTPSRRSPRVAERRRTGAPALLIFLASLSGFTAAEAQIAALHVPARTDSSAAMPYPVDLAPGDRLVLESKGSVDGFAADSSGAIPGGALVARFEDGPPFLVGTGRLLWTAPRAGRLAFSVEQRGAGDVSGGYDVRVTPLGPPGDRRQRRFPPPTLRFLPASKAAVLALAYEDRAGFGLDLRSLKVFLDTRDRRRVVLSPYFTVGPDRAVLRALPSDVDVPAGLHSVTATIADALGNVSAPAVVFLDRP